MVVTNAGYREAGVLMRELWQGQSEAGFERTSYGGLETRLLNARLMMAWIKELNPEYVNKAWMGRY